MKTVVLGLAASLVLASAPPVPAAEEKVDTSQVKIRPAVARMLSPEELQARKERLARRIAARRAAAGRDPSTNVAADTCPAATPEASTLPFTVNDTTAGLANDYEPAISVPLACSAPTSCVGRPDGRGEVFSGTGWGPDKAYRIRTSANCTLNIDLNPTDTGANADDLGLLVYQTQCSNDLTDCACASDNGYPLNELPNLNTEGVVLDAIGGTDYFIVVDGYSSLEEPPGEEGPYTLSISGSGCTLLGDANDLAITKTDGLDSYFPGQTLTYTIEAKNNGATTITGATVADTFPTILTNVSWTCAASAGSSCETASGTGDIDVDVDLVSLGTATFTVTATAVVSATGSLSNTATVTAPIGVTDPDPANNTATDTDTRTGGAFFAVAPCRVADTRQSTGPYGGPALTANQDRTFNLPGSACSIPASATAVFLNVTIVNPSAAGNMQIYPAGSAFPLVSALNYSAGQTRGNNGVFKLNLTGDLNVRASQASGTAHVVLDIAGYFVE